MAVVESRRESWLYAVEFSDHCGEVIHKICLTEQSDFEAFRAWVELNQSSSAPPRFEDVRVASWLENSFLLSTSCSEALRSEGLSTFFQVTTGERLGFQIMPPDDAITFCDYAKDLGEAALGKLRFAVFALGDTSDDNFCQCGRDLDQILEERGASRLLARVDNDVDFEEALASWHEAVIVAIQDTVIV